MKFDDILVHIGEFGPYQKRVYFLLCLPALLCGAQVMSTIFVMATPLHRCQIPGYPEDSYKIQNENHSRLVELYIPASVDSNTRYSECEVVSDVNVSTGWIIGNNSLVGHNGTRAGSRLESCGQWVYDQEDFTSTVVSEFNIVCEETIWRSHANMGLFVGAFIGSVTMGSIADMIGRKKAIMLSLLIQFVTALGVALTPSYPVMLAFRTISGISSYSLFSVSASMGIELVGPSKRTFTGVFVEVYWALGTLLVLPCAYLIRHWRGLQLALAVLTLPFFSLWWLMPESPRWLLDKKRLDEAERVLEKICGSNKSKLPALALSGESEEDVPVTSSWALLTKPVLLVRTLIVVFNWLSVNLLYYGLSLNLENLAGSLYLNFFIGAVFELAGYLLCLLLLDRTGRRRLHCASMITGGLACLAAILPVTLGSGQVWVTTSLAMLGKLCASACYAILYIMTAELFPTVVRNLAIGCCSIFENLGGILAPYVADLGSLVGGPFASVLPMILFGGTSLLAGGLSLLLPETLNRPLPETVEDVLEFDRQAKQSRQSRAHYSNSTGLELQTPMTSSTTSDT